MNTKILNQSQAEAVYSAMCALNNVAADKGAASFESGRMNGIYVNWQTHVVAIQVGVVGPSEYYADQAAFATAYGLQQG